MSVDEKDFWNGKNKDIYLPIPLESQSRVFFVRIHLSFLDFEDDQYQKDFFLFENFFQVKKNLSFNETIANNINPLSRKRKTLTRSEIIF